MKLSESQEAALTHIREYSKSRRTAAVQTLTHILKMCNVEWSDFQRAVESLKSRARCVIHFHPDRLDSHHHTVAESLLAQGVYKSQFETKLSNGSLSAHLGGKRDEWEKVLYGGAYHCDGSALSDRPRYGALALFGHCDGAAPRFGSCYLILKPDVFHRSTFTYLDSHYNPDEKGTLDEFEDILAALFTEVYTRGFALGERNLTVPKLIERLHKGCGPSAEPECLNMGRNLDHYIEVQVHSAVELGSDVEGLVVDPSFKDTEFETILKILCQSYDIKMRWHPGFALELDDVPSDFRGATMPSLARRVATKSYIDVRMIGEAEASLRRSPDAWKDRGSFEDVLQELKYLWHVLVKYGKPLARLSRPVTLETELSGLKVLPQGVF